MVNDGERHSDGGIGGIGRLRNPDEAMSGEDDNAGLQERECWNFIALKVNGGED